MKKQFVNKTRSTVSRFGFAALFALAFSNAFAQAPAKSEDPFLSIKYVRTVADKAQFQVDMVNDAAESYLFSIRTSEGVVLYQEKVTKKIFSKNFLWDNGELNASSLVFSLTGEKSKKSQEFEVNSVVRTINDVEITKL